MAGRRPRPSKKAIRQELNIYAQDKAKIDELYDKEDKDKEKKRGS